MAKALKCEYEIDIPEFSKVSKITTYIKSVIKKPKNSRTLCKIIL